MNKPIMIRGLYPKTKPKQENKKTVIMAVSKDRQLAENVIKVDPRDNELFRIVADKKKIAEEKPKDIIENDDMAMTQPVEPEVVAEPEETPIDKFLSRKKGSRKRK